MDDSKALVVRQEVTPQTWQMIQAMAPAMHASRFFGVGNPEQAMAIMVKGHELGLGLAASFEFIQVVQGKPTLSPRGALALVLNSGKLAGMKIEDGADFCNVWMKRNNGFEYAVRWTVDDAKRAGLVKPGSAWETYTANLLRWRAVGFCIDVVFPDVIGGLKRADELGADLTPEGDVIQGQFTVVQPSPVPAPVSHITLDELVSTYGAEAVMSASGGTIPGTQEQIDQCAEQLKAATA